MIDENTGTVVGSSDTIFRTTDGGDTWTEQSAGTAVHFHGVSFLDANSGIVVGEGGQGLPDG